MKFLPGQTATPYRGASLSRFGIFKETAGGTVFQKHPRKQQRPRTTGEATNRDLLYWSTQVVPLMSAEQQILAREISDISQLAVRDWLFITLFDRAFIIVRPNGTRLYSMASVQDTSNLLDSIWQLDGGLLVRKAGWWTGLAPGTPGQFLGINAQGQPEYATPAAGGGAADSFRSPPPLVPTNQASFNRNFPAFVGIVPASNQTLNGLKVMVTTAPSGVTLEAAIYAAGSGFSMTGGALLASSNAVPAALGEVTMPFTATVNLTEGAVYYIGIWATGGSSNPFFMGQDGSRNGVFFSHSSGALPNPSPTVTASGAGQVFSWWAY